MATLKTCFKCGAEKSISDFYKHPYMGDGHLGKCKECTKRDTAANRSANADYYRAYDRDRASLPHRKALQAFIFNRWKDNFPERRKAQNILAHALRSGKIKKMPCWICGADAEAHHPAYSMPLDVIWLCPLHHQQLHAEARKSA